MHAVCENLKVFGLVGFVERTEAFRFRRDKALNYLDRDRVHWIEHGRHLPRPERAKRGSRTQAKASAQQPKRNKLTMSKANWEKLMAL